MSRRLSGAGQGRERFEEIYASTRLPLLAYLVRRSANVEDAADRLAEVYLVAWRRIADVPPGDEARLWLYGVARRVLSNERRRERREIELAAALETALRLHDTNAGTSIDAGGALEDAVAGALATLRPADRELVLLNAWEELTPAEIAVVLRRPAGVIRVRLHRARRRLRAQLDAAAADESSRTAGKPRYDSLLGAPSD